MATKQNKLQEARPGLAGTGLINKIIRFINKMSENNNGDGTGGPGFSPEVPWPSVWRFGIIVDTGPLGSEADFADERYWVAPAFCNNTSGDDYKVAIKLKKDTYTHIDLNVCATSVSEVASHSHSFKKGDFVVIWPVEDSNGTVRYFFTSGRGGNIIAVSVSVTSATSGNNGTQTTPCDYNYDCDDPDTGLSVATNLSPIMQRKNGNTQPATIGFLRRKKNDSSGASGGSGSGGDDYDLWWCDEVPGAVPCPEESGA